MLLRNFIPETILNSMVNIERPTGNTIPEHHQLVFLAPAFALVTFVAMANYADYTGVFYNIHNVTSELYDPLYFTGFINGYFNETTIESTFLPFTEQVNYKISYFFHTRDSTYFFFNFTPFDILTAIEFVIVTMQHSVFEEVFKRAMDSYKILLDGLVNAGRE